MRGASLLVIIGMLASFPGTAVADNSVVVESKVVLPGATNVSVGVYVENDPYLVAVAVPLEIRQVTPGAFIANTLSASVQGRIALSPLTDFVFDTTYSAPAVDNCSGPVSQGYMHPGPPDFVSPDALFWAGFTTTAGCLAPGSDGLPGSGTPSLLLSFDVTGVEGTFEIDTCCIGYGSHVGLVSTTDGPCGLEQYEIAPSFTKGIIQIGCICNCHADPQCDGVTNVLDVVWAVDVSFRDGPEIPDPSAACPYVTTDVDCNGVTDVLDVVRVVNVAFREGDPATEFCDPCP